MKAPRIITSLAAFLLSSVSWGSPIVWNGPIISFAKPNGVDWTLPLYQDQITPLVALTRANTQGLFNIQAEPAFAHNLTPSGTEWAFGTTASYFSLTYTNWDMWANSAPAFGPPGTVNRDAVVHLIAEDIYVDIKFTSWSASASGGGFAYERSTVPEPASLALLGVGAVRLAVRRRQPGGRIA